MLSPLFHTRWEKDVSYSPLKNKRQEPLKSVEPPDSTMLEKSVRLRPTSDFWMAKTSTSWSPSHSSPIRSGRNKSSGARKRAEPICKERSQHRGEKTAVCYSSLSAASRLCLSEIKLQRNKAFLDIHATSLALKWPPSQPTASSKDAISILQMKEMKKFAQLHTAGQWLRSKWIHLWYWR